MGNERNVRQRKRQMDQSEQKRQFGIEDIAVPSKQSLGLIEKVWLLINLIVGVCVMLKIGHKYAWYCYDLHEAQMWFTNIKEVEREISFRTECGLYYSYYKQMVTAPSISEGLNQLANDQLSEHPRTMNVLERMNIYQEVLLAVLYRTFPFLQEWNWRRPIFFYITSVYALNGGLVCSLYAMTWLLSGSWMSGVIAVAFYTFNKDDTTRAPYTIALRESFSLPFLWAQLAIMTYYFRPKRSKLQERVCVVGLLLSTCCFALTWQFNQFVLLLQSMALFGVQVLQLAPHYKIKVVYIIQIVSLLGVCILQFFNTMIIGGLVFSFVPGALLLMRLQGERPSSSGICSRLFKIVLYILAVFIFMLVTNVFIKLFIHVDSDEHIYKFVLHKLGIEESREMDVWLYLCVGSFDYLGYDFYERLTKRWVFPLYAVVQVMGLILLVKQLFQKWRYQQTYKKSEDEEIKQIETWIEERPELAYHLIQTVFFGGMALTTLRMKYLWTPYMCVLGATLIGDQHLYAWVLDKIQFSSRVLLEFLRILVCISVFCGLCYTSMPEVRKELGSLREFYDPDTVQLMEWINKSTPAGAAFSGSMQLLAGVKLCTGRPVTNHPHYEDKLLRDTTKQILQMYGRKPVEEVHSILKQYDSSYIILEDSICLVPPSRECGTPNLVDMHNGVTALKHKAGDGLAFTTAPKFCDEIRHMKEPYSKYFREVFKNKTFRIYKVL